jgi:hypothetical protein
MVRKSSVFFFLRKSIIDKILAVRLEGGCFGQGIKWDAPLSSNFGLGLWRLHTMPCRGLQLLYFVGYIYIFSPVIWALTNVWPLNLTASRLRRPLCETALSSSSTSMQTWY